MRPRAVGGYEPDDADQRELVELWHLSRTARAGMSLPHQRATALYHGGERGARIEWVVGEFLKAHPDAGRKWVYVWCAEFLGAPTEAGWSVESSGRGYRPGRRTR